MFNKPSWNNRRGGYLKPPDKQQEEKQQSILESMKSAVSQQKEKAEKMSLAEIAKQDHYDLDGSIAIEAQKTVQLIQPKTKGKFNPIVIPHVPDILVTKQVEQQTTEEKEEEPIQKLMDALRVVLSTLDNAHTKSELLQEGVHQADLETSDLLHSIELTEFDENEKSDMTDKIKEVRMRRRTQKRHLEYMTEIDAYVIENKSAVEALKTLKGKLNKIKERQENAMYRPRIRTDLKKNEKIQP